MADSAVVLDSESSAPAMRQKALQDDPAGAETMGLPETTEALAALEDLDPQEALEGPETKDHLEILEALEHLDHLV